MNGTVSYQNLQDDKVELTIDKAKSFAFKVDDVDKAQADINIINEATTDAAFQMKIAIDAAVLQSVYADATTTLPTLTMDKTNVIDWIVDASVKLKELNIPAEDRYLLIPPKAMGYLQKSDLKNAMIMGDDVSVLRKKDYIGDIAGFKIYVSNNLASSGTTYQCFAGHKQAVTFAQQVTKVETVRLQDQFGDAVRGLNVFGFKTVFPNGLVSMPAVIA